MDCLHIFKSIIKENRFNVVLPVILDLIVI